MIRTYSDLIKHSSFLDRFNYLKLHGSVGRDTFGFDRYLNQAFYTSREWKHVRSFVIARDEACDLGVIGYDIHHRILIHHMNPVVTDDILHGNSDILDPEFLITTSHKTHNAIHYGDASLLPQPFVNRKPHDTRLW